MEGNLDRIKSLEASRDIMQRKLKEMFVSIERISEKQAFLNENVEKIEERLSGLIEKTDGIVDGIIKLENEIAVLKELSHEHRIIK